MQNEILNKYGKYIAFAIMTFGGSALALYARFLIVEIEIETVEEKVKEKAELIKDHEQRIRKLECND